MSCTLGCVKVFVFLFNFLFCLGGLAIAAFGVLIHTTLNRSIVDKTVSENFMGPAVLLIVVGAIIFIIAFFGCCGVARESHCMIITFAVLLLSLVVIQIVIAALGFIFFNGDFEKNINENLEKAVQHYYDNESQAGVDGVQLLVHCCGYKSYQDYFVLSEMNYKIPYSCCNAPYKSYCEISKVQNLPGCGETLVPFLKHYANALGGLALSIGAIELIGVILSFYLANSIRNYERRGYKV